MPYEQESSRCSFVQRTLTSCLLANYQSTASVNKDGRITEQVAVLLTGESRCVFKDFVEFRRA